MEDTSENSTTTFMKYEESTDQIADLSPVEKFTCSLCGLKFHQQRYLTNHFKLCKGVEDPPAKFGIDIVTIKKELETEDEMYSMGFFDEHTTPVPTLNVKLEEIEFTETTISGTASPQYEQPMESLKTEIPVESTQLEEHAKVDQPGKPYRCTVCDYACAYQSILTVHMRKHTGEKPFKCTMCDYASKQQSTLTVHMRTHTGTKPFKCTICDYASTRRSALKLHVRQHTGEKPYKCTMCEYAGMQGYALTEHMRTHTGEKPYKCTICDYASNHCSSFRVHMRKHAR